MPPFSSLAHFSHSAPGFPITTVLSLMVAIGILTSAIFLIGIAPMVGQEKVEQVFNRSEDINNFLRDLNLPSIPSFSPVCGNGTCENGETISNCLQDCFACNANGTCESGLGENSNSCPADCVAAPAASGGGGGGGGGGPGGNTNPPSCGDGSCNGSENCSSCAQDCGTCSETCGDGVCAADEDCSICADDCGSCPSTACTDEGGVCANSCTGEQVHYANGDAECGESQVCCIVSTCEAGQLFTISGYIKDANGVGIADIPVTDGTNTVTTNASGYYKITEPCGWSGTITPGSTGGAFFN